MTINEIHDIIRLARSKYYNLDGCRFQYMCNCVAQLQYDGDIDYGQKVEVIDYISSLLGGNYALAGHLIDIGLEFDDIQAAKLKFWDNLLGEDDVQT